MDSSKSELSNIDRCVINNELEINPRNSKCLNMLRFAASPKNNNVICLSLDSLER